MALIDKETIRAEIERRRSKAEYEKDAAFGIHDAYIIHQAEELLCLVLLSFLDTLPEQPVEGLEEEIARYLREECSGDDEPSVSDIARHFAEWGAEHLKK